MPAFRSFCSCVSRSGRGIGLTCRSRTVDKKLLSVVGRDHQHSHMVKCSLGKIRGSSLVVRLKSFPVGQRKSRKRGGACLVTLGLTRFSFLGGANNGAAPLLLLSSVFSGLSTFHIRRVMGLMTKSHFKRVFVASAGQSRLSGVLGGVRERCGIFTMRSKRIAREGRVTR